MLSYPQKSEPEKFEIRFTVYAEQGTLEYELLAYLKRNKSMSRDRFKEMAMAALTAYYLPPARVNNSAVTREQRHLAVLEGIQRLRLQEQYFRELDGLCGEISAFELKSSSENVDDIHALQAVSEYPSLTPKKAELADKPEPEFDPEEMF